MNLLILFAILLSSKAYNSKPRRCHGGYLTLMAGKGFGAEKAPNSAAVDLIPTRAYEYKEVSGSYARLLARHCDIYDAIKASSDDHQKWDVYARLDNTQIFWFIGKYACYNSMSMYEGFTTVQTLMTEYAKSLRPNELAGNS